ncbi:MAG: carboxylesterase family protein, partial [Gemmatimonadetes bacterium]|nr:carboxylesterase family protein [Gemmatimonadota bacterium]
MRRLLTATLALVVAAATLPAQDTPPTRVTTSFGPLAGRDSAGIATFRNIPYAAPPVGALRWKAPVRPARWTAPRDASQFGPACMQTDALSKLYGGAMDPVSEDCLTLNVWTPVARGAKRPVLVWIHGGAFTHGSGRTALYDGTRLAQLGAVVVTLNYRLGVFGYLAHPALSAESPKHGSGAYGFLDQVAALQWVR